MLNRRAWNIALRTAHIAAMGVLLGGHAFDVESERLVSVLWLSVGSGVLLAVVEAGSKWLLYLQQLRSWFTFFKLGLLMLVPLAWDQRLPILLVVVVLGSVGSHMPARFRHYSVPAGKVLPEPATSGTAPGQEQLQQPAGSGRLDSRR